MKKSVYLLALAFRFHRARIPDCIFGTGTCPLVGSEDPIGVPRNSGRAHRRLLLSSGTILADLVEVCREVRNGRGEPAALRSRVPVVPVAPSSCYKA
jgi:hypothetical protein